LVLAPHKITGDVCYPTARRFVWRGRQRRRWRRRVRPRPGYRRQSSARAATTSSSEISTGWGRRATGSRSHRSGGRRGRRRRCRRRWRRRGTVGEGGVQGGDGVGTWPHRQCAPPCYRALARRATAQPSTSAAAATSTPTIIARAAGPSARIQLPHELRHADDLPPWRCAAPASARPRQPRLHGEGSGTFRSANPRELRT
jgi:hypothetical protein